MSQEVSPRAENPLAVFAAKQAALDLEASLISDNQRLAEWQQTKLAAILTAGTFEQINLLMTQSGLTAAQTLVGRTLEIRDFAVRESAEGYREGSQLKKWALVEAVDVTTGEDFVIDGGGDQFMAGLVQMRDLYGFPYTGTLLGMATSTPGRTLIYWRFHDPKRKPVA